MLSRSITFLLILAASTAAAQTVPPAGTSGTFDVATWNIEYFGTDCDVDGTAPCNNGNNNGPPVQVQLDNVHDLISQAGIDLWAIQEIASPGKGSDGVTPETWDDLIADLADDGYSGFYAPSGFSNIRVGYVYNPSVVTVVDVLESIPQQQFFDGRKPLELVADVTVGGVTERLHFINIHATSSSATPRHFNRVEGARLLKAYADGLIDDGKSVIVLGDFNDSLREARWAGCVRPDEVDDYPDLDVCDIDNLPPPVPSPYYPFLTDSDYNAATLALEQAGIATACAGSVRDATGTWVPCGGDATIDHVLYSSDLPDPVRVRRYQGALDYFGNFTGLVSDHAPVYARFDLSAAPRPGNSVAGSAGSRPVGGARLLAPAPNPFRGAADLRFELDAASDVRLDVFDVMGRSVLGVAGSFAAGDHTVTLDGGSLAPGAYVVRWTAGDAVQSSVIVRAD